MNAPWHALVLAAGRGENDPMAKAFGVTHKAKLALGGTPMLQRVVTALQASANVGKITVCIESRAILADILGRSADAVSFCPSASSAPASVLAALAGNISYPVLVTTADHALLTPAMVDHFCNEATANAADCSVGLATAETILAAYPQSVRTFFRLGRDRVSGCNLFALTNARAKLLVERWQYLDQHRKQPLKLVSAFGFAALVRFALEWINVQSAFRLVSERLGLHVRPVLMPFAEAAIDVDKPSDYELVESILARQAGKA